MRIAATTAIDIFFRRYLGFWEGNCFGGEVEGFASTTRVVAEGRGGAGVAWTKFSTNENLFFVKKKKKRVKEEE
jgi:hypothetical protein